MGEGRGGGNGRRPLNKLYLMAQTDKQTNRQTDIATLRLNQPSGQIQ